MLHAIIAPQNDKAAHRCGYPFTLVAVRTTAYASEMKRYSASARHGVTSNTSTGANRRPEGRVGFTPPRVRVEPAVRDGPPLPRCGDPAPASSDGRTVGERDEDVDDEQGAQDDRHQQGDPERDQHPPVLRSGAGADEAGED